WWAAAAARRGFLVIAPEYRLQGQGKEYGYSPSEHAAVTLALRDAKRRYSIDSDRVFLGGQLVGGNMAWDFGLAHPDLFAGVVIVSGLPFKYVGKYLAHARTTKLPLHVTLGDLAPAGNELVFNQILKPMITDAALDVTYLEYHQRGLEDFPEEAPGALEWMESRRRDPNPKSFEVLSARDSDVRFYGLVVREFQQGRTTSPEAVDPFGKNLKPATLSMRSSAASNLIDLRTVGVRKLDIWISPDLIDFKRKVEIRINRDTYYKGNVKPDLQAFLEDLRIRGDREQVYWLKVPAG
ncbi:MAG: PHB depolymerase family esterase, partial [Isosphaeraceae bacterium]